MISTELSLERIVTENRIKADVIPADSQLLHSSLVRMIKYGIELKDFFTYIHPRADNLRIGSYYYNPKTLVAIRFLLPAKDLILKQIIQDVQNNNLVHLGFAVSSDYKEENDLMSSVRERCTDVFNNRQQIKEFKSNEVKREAA